MKIIAIFVIFISNTALADNYLVIKPNNHINAPIPSYNFEYNSEYNPIITYKSEKTYSFNEWKIDEHSTIKVEAIPIFDKDLSKISDGQFILKYILK